MTERTETQDPAGRTTPPASGKRPSRDEAADDNGAPAARPGGAVAREAGTADADEHTATADAPRAKPAAGDTDAGSGGRRTGRTLVIRRPGARSLPLLAAMLLAIAFAVLWGTGDPTGELGDLRDELAADRQAEQIAGDYALGASQVEHTDLETWRRALRDRVTPQLAAELSAAVDVVGPWLAQMEYRSTATVLAAKVTGRDGDLYTVQAFVEMRSTSRQAPEGVTATAAYTLTLNRAAHWTVTDVSGSGPAAGAGETTPGPGLPPR
ncbi:hypothetical protein [Nocardia rhamnosiphila]